MGSLLNSLLEATFSIAPSGADICDSIVQDIKGFSLDVLDRKVGSRFNPSDKTDAAHIHGRAQRLRNEFQDSSDDLRKTLSRQEVALAEKSKEIEALKDCKSKLCDKIEQLSAEIEKLREREYHTRTILEVNKESTDVINSGLSTIRRYAGQVLCAPSPGTSDD